jgi:hypothetical protein
MARIGAAAHLDEHDGSIRGLHNQVDFAAAATGRPIIARDQPQTLTLQVCQGSVFRSIPDLFGGAFGRWS